MIFKGRYCRVSCCTISVNDEELQCTTTAIHLGHTINSDDKESIISAAISQFWKSFNIFTADFGHIHPRLQCNLFKQYCCTFYGAPLWCFSTYGRLCIAWRKALRKLWQVPSMTHGNVLALLDSKQLDICLMQRFCKFCVNIEKQGSKLIKAVALR